jgi:Mn-dependent DtxR family transcriptional regulator
MPKGKSNFRQKYVEGIVEKIKKGNVNIKDLPALCSVTFPYVKPETTTEILESLKKLNMIKVDEGGNISYIS